MRRTIAVVCLLVCGWWTFATANTFQISYFDFQRAVNVLSALSTRPVVLYQVRSDGGYNLYLVHEKISGHAFLAAAQGADATSFEVWKSTCLAITGLRDTQ